jgi:hypothetical protein
MPERILLTNQPARLLLACQRVIKVVVVPLFFLVLPSPACFDLLLLQLVRPDVHICVSLLVSSSHAHAHARVCI